MFVRWIAAACVGTIIPFANAIASDEVIPAGELAGTFWVSETPYELTRVSPGGDTEVRTMKVVLYVLDHNSGAYSIKANWWNEQSGANVVEHGVMVHAGPNRFAYEEMPNFEDKEFPGVSGGGVFQVIDQDTAEYYQIGRFSDGAVGAFATTLTRVAEPPTAPMEPTYPTN